MALSTNLSLAVGSRIEANLYASRARPALDESIFKPTADQLSLLRSTLHMEDDQIREHAISVQKEAYKEFPYTCITLFTNLSFFISAQPVYQEVLAAGKEGQDAIFLDVGCCMGSDARKLVFDGYPGRNVYATDLHARYIELGHQLFADADTCEITFFPADLFSLQTVPRRAISEESPPGERPLETLRGKVSHIYAGLFFHLFDERMQQEVARRLAILVSRQPGSIVFGAHAGSTSEASGLRVLAGSIRFCHSQSSFSALWKSVFTELEGEEYAEEHVAVESELRDTGSFFPSLRGEPILLWNLKII